MSNEMKEYIFLETTPKFILGKKDGKYTISQGNNNEYVKLQEFDSLDDSIMALEEIIGNNRGIIWE